MIDLEAIRARNEARKAYYLAKGYSPEGGAPTDIDALIAEVERLRSLLPDAFDLADFHCEDGDELGVIARRLRAQIESFKRED